MILFDGRRDLSLFSQGIAQVVVGLGEVRSDPQCVMKMLDGGFDLSLLAQGIGQVVMSHGVVRVDL